MDRPELFQSKTVREIATEADWEALVENVSGRVMVEFFVTWCPHCQREAPLLDDAAADIRALGVELYHANAEVMWTKGSVYGISETPSFILLEGGKLIAKHEGFLDESQLIGFAKDEIDDSASDPSQRLSSLLEL